jgi:tryptophan-rich sensory protein
VGERSGRSAGLCKLSRAAEHRSVRAILAAVAGSTLTAAVGGLGARRAPTAYEHLEKPGWAPPPSAFGPVWTGLYALMAAAVYRAWRSDPERSAGLVALHGGQLALNASWPWAFFSLRSRTAALVVIAALDAAVAAEVIVAGRRDRVAGWLLTPYLAWSLFATALTAAVGDPTGVESASNPSGG